MEEGIKGWLELLASLRGYASLNDYIEDLGRREVQSLDEATRQQILALQSKLSKRPLARSVTPETREEYAARPKRARKR